ncbi:MAG TPA: DUF488 domain-containing protein [Vicinamibacterales bacterium]|nr:DUF488 domain-containing protein [Vicinamibacterales bacterium]
MLREAGVTRLADVRAIPRSRTNPQFNKDTLSTALQAQGIDYHHIPQLGGRRNSRTDRPSRNAYWRIQAFRNYADYAETGAFRAALDELQQLARELPTAIMCAEAVWWRCHRRLITDYLIIRGWEVVHLMSPGQMQPALLTPAAVAESDGTISYPASPDVELPFHKT